MQKTMCYAILASFFAIGAATHGFAQLLATKVADLSPDGSSSPATFVVGGAANDRLYFSTRNTPINAAATFGIHATDGTAEGTSTLVWDRYPVYVAQATPSAVYYQRQVDAIKSSVHSISPQAIAAPVTAAAASPALQLSWPEPARSVMLGDRLITGIWFEGMGTEVGAYSAVDNTTTLIKEIVPGANGSGPAYFLTANSQVFFCANSSTNGGELWSTDGTTAGTNRISDIGPGTESAWIPGLVAVGSRLYFSAMDKPTNSEPWICNGTPAAVSKLLEVNIVATVGSSPRDFTALGKQVFFSADKGIGGRELWVTDGTTAGTKMLKDLNITGGSDPHGLVVYNKLLYFFAYDGLSRLEKLYSTDGTAANTKACFSIASGTKGSGTIVCNGNLFYVTRAAASPFASKLWRTNGTTAGTAQVTATITVDPNGGNTVTLPPANAIGSGSMKAMGSWLFFSADLDGKGQELWKVQ